MNIYKCITLDDSAPELSRSSSEDEYCVKKLRYREVCDYKWNEIERDIFIPRFGLSANDCLPKYDNETWKELHIRKKIEIGYTLYGDYHYDGAGKLVQDKILWMMRRFKLRILKRFVIGAPTTAWRALFSSPAGYAFTLYFCLDEPSLEAFAIDKSVDGMLYVSQKYICV